MSFDDDDRRNYFRVEDALQVTYRQIPPEEKEAWLESYRKGLSGGFSASAEVMMMRQEVVTLMRNIALQYPDIGAYLASLDRRVEVLARHVDAVHSDLTEQPIRSGNISASGLAMHVEKPLNPGILLEMKLLLLPSYTGMVLPAEVVDCDKTEDAEMPYLLRVNFSYLREQDRDMLIRHVIQRQSEMLRKRREEREERASLTNE